MLAKNADSVRVGKDEMPIIGLGTWKSEEGEVGAAVKEALRAGYRHIDCAFIYGNEEEIGRAFEEIWKEGKIKREDVWITSKLWNDYHKKDDVEKMCRESLKRLRLEYLDLYLIHWPVVTDNKGKQLNPPIKETWQAMEQLVEKGLVKHIGLSNFSRKKTADVLSYAKIKPEMVQVEAHPYFQNRKLFEYLKENGIPMTAYSPLGSPDSAHMSDRTTPPLLEDKTVKEIAKKLDKNPGQVLIRWAIQRGTAVIPKSVHSERIRSNLDVFDWSIPEEDFNKLCNFKRNERYIDGGFFVSEDGPYPNVKAIWDDDNE